MKPKCEFLSLVRAVAEQDGDCIAQPEQIRVRSFRGKKFHLCPTCELLYGMITGTRVAGYCTRCYHPTSRQRDSLCEDCAPTGRPRKVQVEWDEGAMQRLAEHIVAHAKSEGGKL